MSLSSAVDWWEEWQLRILVLGSLFIQYLLLFSASFRKFAIPSWYRSIIWLAYQGSDAVAIYALATLFNRQRSQDHGTSAKNSSILEVVWAPVLLMHLGGQDVITAYNIEDNELWTRHLLTAVSQVTVAIYVFCKSWPGGDKRLLQASILFFVPGILKCIDKPWALRRASINSLVSSSDPAPRMASMVGKTISLEEYVKEARAFAQAVNYPQAQAEDNAVDPKHTHFSRAQGEAGAEDLEANHHPQDHGEDHSDELNPNHAPKPEEKASSGRRATTVRSEEWEKGNHDPLKLFVDLASSYHERLRILESFWVLGDDEESYTSLRRGLFNTFDLLYTKKKMNRFLAEKAPEVTSFLDFLSACVFGSVGYLPWAAIGLFHKSHREAYNVNDIKVTYALFCCTAVLEISTLYFHTISLGIVPISTGMVAQYSLVGFFARNKRHSKKMCLLSSFGCKDFLDQHWCMKSCSSSSRIIELVLKYVKKGWKSQIKDANTYWKFNDRRGQWTLQTNKCKQELGCSLRRSFDESVLLWHIATDFCFFYLGASADHQCATAQCIQDACGEGHGCAVWCERSPHHGRAVRCREMSNYMMYLLFVNPEMLLSGTRQNLFTTANAELEEILKDDDPSLKKFLKGDKPSLMEILKCDKPFCKLFTRKRPSLKEIERGFIQKIIAKVQPTENREQVEHTNLPLDAETDATTQEGFVHDAWNLANGLLRIGDDEKMWEVIEGVWVEMLCFSASRCRGYLHAKSLGTGPELLTYIWLLLSHMGMETLPERLQRTELSNEEGNAGAPPPTSQIPGSGDPPPSRRSRSHEVAAAGASTSRLKEIQPAK